MDITFFSYGFIFGIGVIILTFNLLLAFKGFDKELNYSIVFVGIFILLYFWGHILIYSATNVPEIIFGNKLLNVSILLASIAFLVFSYYYAKSINKKIIFSMSLLAIILIVIVLARPYGLLFDKLDVTYNFEGSWKTEYSYLPGVKSNWINLLLVFAIIYLMFITYVATIILKEKRYSEGIQYIVSLLIIIIAVLVNGFIFKIREEFALAAMLILMSIKLFSKLLNSYSVEVAFKHSEEKYKRLFDNSAFGIYQTTMDGKFLMLNRAGKEILGIQESENINKTNFATQIYSNKEERDNLKKILLQNGSIYNYEIQLKKGNNETIYAREYARLVKDKIGNVIIEGAFEDITENKKNELLIIKAKEIAEKSDSLKSEFLAQMSHEIRTPINIISGNSEYIKEMISGDLKTEIEECFESIDLATSRIIRTTDLIINASELQKGGFQPIFANVDLNNKVLKKIFNEYQKIANKKGIEFNYKCESEEVLIFGDEYCLNQIFVNLVDNAIKYTIEGKVEIILSKLTNNSIVAEIIDTGIGISDDFKEQMFLPFAQEEQGYKRKYDGNGLGLTLVKGYLDLHKAKLEVESSKNNGSKFRVIFD